MKELDEARRRARFLKELDERKYFTKGFIEGYEYAKGEAYKEHKEEVIRETAQAMYDCASMEVIDDI